MEFGIYKEASRSGYYSIPHDMRLDIRSGKITGIAQLLVGQSYVKVVLSFFKIPSFLIYLRLSIMSIRLRLKIIIGILFFAMIGNGFFFYLIDHYGKEKLKWVNHTHKVLIGTEYYLSALQDTETSQRGYLLTNNPSYLEPYYKGLVTAKESFSKLLILVSDNPAQIKRLDAISELMKLKLNELRITISLTQGLKESKEKALEIVKQNKGKQYMDDIRTHISQFKSTELVLLEKRKGNYRSHKAKIYTAIVGEMLFFLLFGILTVIFLNKNFFDPLNMLIFNTKKMEKGKKIDILDILPNHEMGYLLRSFFKMNQKVYQRSKRLDYKAHHDQLTGLKNRSNLLDEIKEAVKNAKEFNTKTAVLFLDIDKFKQLNDTMGHDAGDAMLIETANRLINAIRSEDIAFRVGGDEFVILLKNIAKISDAEKIVSNILNVFQSPMSINDTSIDILISIGVSIAPDNSEDSEKLLKMSDIAMYASKKDKVICYKLFNTGMLKRSCD
jgi:diguanylate cyclase (GGDEF)-like protein